MDASDIFPVVQSARRQKSDQDMIPLKIQNH